MACVSMLIIDLIDHGMIAHSVIHLSNLDILQQVNLELRLRQACIMLCNSTSVHNRSGALRNLGGDALRVLQLSAHYFILAAAAVTR